MKKPLLILLGNQLFPRRCLPPSDKVTVFICEDLGLCTYVRHHQQKIVLFLAAMRTYADELTEAGYTVRYVHLDVDSDQIYEDRLQAAIAAEDCDELMHFEIEDKAMERRIHAFDDETGIERTELESPMFICSRGEFSDHVNGRGHLRMAEFYKQQRRRLGILIDDAGEPVGGRWSYDDENRKRLPAAVSPPQLASGKRSAHVDDVIRIVREHFAHHPGNAEDFWWPTSRRGALKWLRDFLDSRLAQFGPYEDAISTRSSTVFHSVLSPLVNLGLITPDEIIDRALAHADEHEIPLQSLEGFVRQLIGWREFIRGVYREWGDKQESANFWSHERKLTEAWYDGNTGIPPLDDTIRTAQALGWTHHIPRLMIVANLMTLCEIEPRAAHDWFMEMYVDSSEWVMGPNVYGMGLFSDGGLFATKPYICGSNYMLKMSDYSKGDWCETVDGLYWRFIDKHRDFFSGNPRLALMPRALDRLADDRRQRIFAAADTFLDDYTQ